MITRLRRFHGYNALRFVYKLGRTSRLQPNTVEGQVFTLRYAQNPRRKTYRLAVVVSKKQNKSAVVRNRIRRRLYEVGRELIPTDIPYDLVITVLDDKVASMSKKDINKILYELLQMSGIGEPGNSSHP